MKKAVRTNKQIKAMLKRKLGIFKSDIKFVKDGNYFNVVSVKSYFSGMICKLVIEILTEKGISCTVDIFKGQPVIEVLP